MESHSATHGVVRRRQTHLLRVGFSNQEEHSIARSNTPTPLTLYDGRAIERCEEFPPAIVRRCLALHEQNSQTGLNVILQRLGPQNKFNHDAQVKSQDEGRGLMEDMLQKVATAQGDHTPLKLGLSYDESLQNLEVTPQTKQENGDAQEAVLLFMTWVQSYCEQYVKPLVQKLSVAFRMDLTERIEVHYPWLSDVCRESRLCHPLYSAFTPLKGFSSHPQRDELDGGVTILINFGSGGRLVLPEYSVAVDLQPLEVVFFRATCVQYYTMPHPYDSAEVHNSRWSVTCSFQRKMEEHVVPRAASWDLVSMMQNLRDHPPAGRRPSSIPRPRVPSTPSIPPAASSLAITMPVAPTADVTRPATPSEGIIAPPIVPSMLTPHSAPPTQTTHPVSQAAESAQPVAPSTDIAPPASAPVLAPSTQVTGTQISSTGASNLEKSPPKTPLMVTLKRAKTTPKAPLEAQAQPQTPAPSPLPAPLRQASTSPKTATPQRTPSEATVPQRSTPRKTPQATSSTELSSSSLGVGRKRKRHTPQRLAEYEITVSMPTASADPYATLNPSNQSSSPLTDVDDLEIGKDTNVQEFSLFKPFTDEDMDRVLDVSPRLDKAKRRREISRSSHLP